MSRKGKIARLPEAIRTELNLRLLNGESGAKILPWLNELPETKAVLEEDFEGLRVTDQNLSEWRKGGFDEWQRRRERIADTKELANFARDITKAGGSLSDGAAAIAAGKLLEILEGLGDEKPDAETLDALTLALSRLRAGDHTAEKLRLTTLRLDQTAELLELEKAKFLSAAKDKLKAALENQQAQSILANTATDNTAKLNALGKVIFGDLWK